MIATGVLFLIALGVYIPYSLTTVGGPSGGSVIGLIYGITGFLLMLFATLLSLRKKFPVWRIGKAQTWMRGHLWLGLLSYPLILFHAGFSLGGTLTNVLIWILTTIIISGLFGAALQHIMPRLITQRVPMETIYDQIDNVQKQLLAEADGLVAQVAKAASRNSIQIDPNASGILSTTTLIAVEEEPLEKLKEIYGERIRPFLATRGDYRNPLYERKNAKGMFARLRTMTPPAVKEILDDIENICEEKRDLDRQSRMHRILHGWLFVHIPLSYAVIILGLIHAVAALRY
jgi:hypothetical protein